jgi:hypothetical protein
MDFHISGCLSSWLMLRLHILSSIVVVVVVVVESECVGEGHI